MPVSKVQLSVFVRPAIFSFIFNSIKAFAEFKALMPTTQHHLLDHNHSCSTNSLLMEEILHLICQVSNGTAQMLARQNEYLRYHWLQTQYNSIPRHCCLTPYCFECWKLNGRGHMITKFICETWHPLTSQMACEQVYSSELAMHCCWTQSDYAMQEYVDLVQI